MSDKPIAAGKSSYDMIDTAAFWPALNLEKGSVMLDLGCGIGNYAVEAAVRIGQSGRIYAIDAWAEGIEQLKTRMTEKGLSNIVPTVADISRHIPVDADNIDLCLMATVAHDLIQDKRFEGTMTAINQILPRGRRLAIVEFKKQPGPPGPPPHIRLSPEELDQAVASFGYRRIALDDVSPYHYLAQYTAS